MSSISTSSNWHSSRRIHQAPWRTPALKLSVRRGLLGLMVLTLFGVARLPEAAAQSPYQYTQLQNPSRVEVRDKQKKWVATFTTGCYTVTLSGAARTFSEPLSTTATVSHSVWVRTLPAPFVAPVNETWLTNARANTAPDVLQFGMQYIAGAPAIYNASNLKIAGDADYGPLQADGTRQEGSDFNDYLGISWAYPTGVDSPEATQLNCLDCSGFVRMALGYRCGVPMTLDPNGTQLPRRSFQMYASAPGIVTIANTGVQVTNFSALSVGDLLFFDASTDDGTQIDHVGVFLGVDSVGKHRFLSSRKTINGPTLGDTGGLSILNGTGYYAKAFRAGRRL